MNIWGKVVGLKGKNAVLSVKETQENKTIIRYRAGREENEIIVEAKNKAGAKVGDTVEISREEAMLWEKLFIKFGIPFTDGIIGGFIGYMIVKLFNQTNYIIWILVFGIIFMLLSYIRFSKFFGNKKMKSNKFIVSSIIYEQE